MGSLWGAPEVGGEKVRLEMKEEVQNHAVECRRSFLLWCCRNHNPKNTNNVEKKPARGHEAKREAEPNRPRKA